MARRVNQRAKPTQPGSPKRLSWRVGGLLGAAALAFLAGIGVGVLLGDKDKRAAIPAPSEVSRATPTVQMSNNASDRAFSPPLAGHRHPPVEAARPARITLAPPPTAPSSTFAPRAPDAARNWEINALPYSVPPGTPLIAIVLDDMGLDRRRSERATRLPGPLTLSYLSYADDLIAQTGAARARGHELMLHLPMEPQGNADPGPGALLMRLGDAELSERIDFALGRFPRFVGVNNHMGSRFTADRRRMGLVFDAMRKSGHLFLDSLTTRDAVAMKLGPEAGVPTIARDVFLDDVDSEDEVWFRLLKTEQIAEVNGTAIAIGHPRDATLAVLEDWIAELHHRSARLAPVSAVARVRLGRHHQVMVKP